MIRRVAAIGAAWLLAAAATPGLSAAEGDAQAIRPALERFAAETPEVPDFQRHVLPLMGRLGCNSRACHGSFQGAGGFRLSLFGYDFKADHEALFAKDAGRVTLDDPEESKVLKKPTLLEPHKGGKRMEYDGWAYHLFARWIEAGGPGVDSDAAPQFERLEVSPREVVFKNPGDTEALRVIAVWSDGSREDVTCLTRFRTNDESVAEISEEGVVSCLGSGDTHVVAFYDNGVTPIPVMRPVSDQVGDRYPTLKPPATPIDARIGEKLRKLGIVPSELCTDAEFLRRVSLDLTGTLPSPGAIAAFLADEDPAKRSRKVDELLESPAYVAWWTTVLCDITGNQPRQFQGMPTPEILSKQWYEWIAKRVADNTPYDQLMAGIALGSSRKAGQSYDDFAAEQSSYFRDKDPADFAGRETMPYFWARRNIRKPEEKALAFSYSFLGVRLECAQCHKHPFDQWTQDDFKHFQAFFEPIGFGIAPDARQRAKELQESLELPKNNGQAQRKIAELAREGKVVPWQEVFVNRNSVAARSKGVKDAVAKKNARANARIITPKVLGGDEVELSADIDPRQPLLDWMRSDANPYFARSFINRVWANYFGRGIVNPPDDMNLANPPSNEALLNELADGFVAAGFDMKWLHRQVLGSHAYQRSWQTNETNRNDDRNFSRAAVRRLPAEVTIDAVLMATADTDKRAKLDDRMDGRAIGPNALAASAGRGSTAYAAKVFGVSTRDTNCDCNRSNEPNLLQAVFLQNDQNVLDSILKGGWLAEAVASLRGEASKPAATVAGPDVRPRARAAAKAKAKGISDEVLEARLKQRMEKRGLLPPAEAPRGAAEADGKVEAPAAEAVDAVIRDAFLRTLSRPPTDDDLAASRAYLDDAEPSKGLRDLMWALLNTKEFITNH